MPIFGIFIDGKFPLSTAKRPFFPLAEAKKKNDGRFSESFFMWTLEIFSLFKAYLEHSEAEMLTWEKKIVKRCKMIFFSGEIDLTSFSFGASRRGRNENQRHLRTFYSKRSKRERSNVWLGEKKNYDAVEEV